MKYLNNPFNIRYTGQRWLGLSGSCNGFCEFKDIRYSIRAWLIIMRTYRIKYNISTIRDIIVRYAPPSENDVNTYIDYISLSLGLLAYSVLDFDSDYYNLAVLMSKFESNYKLNYYVVCDVAKTYNIHIVP